MENANPKTQIAQKLRAKVAELSPIIDEAHELGLEVSILHGEIPKNLKTIPIHIPNDLIQFIESGEELKLMARAKKIAAHVRVSITEKH